jgi:hypothetical protein
MYRATDVDERQQLRGPRPCRIVWVRLSQVLVKAQGRIAHVGDMSGRKPKHAELRTETAVAQSLIRSAKRLGQRERCDLLDLKAEGTGPLFDVDNMLRVFEYNPNLWQTTIEKDLPKLRDFVKGAWENRASEKTYMKILRGKAKASG